MSNFQGIRAALRLMAVAALSLLATFGASAQTVRYIHTDGLGSVVSMTDRDRNVVERSEYEPYGSLLNRPMTDGPGYTGHVSDATTGLTYMQQRYYDQSLGVFLSVDPVDPASDPVIQFNRYRYGGGNPYKFIDPDGRIIVTSGDVDAIKKDLNVITSKPVGRDLVKRLSDSKNVHNINYGAGEQAETTPANINAIPNADGSPGSGSGSSVQIDSSKPIYEAGEDGPVEVSGPIKLAHELGHSDAMDQGKQSTDRGSGTWGTTPASEDHSMQMENGVRSEQGIKERDSYYREPVAPPKK